jgi:hypothetical protein
MMPLLHSPSQQVNGHCYTCSLSKRIKDAGIDGIMLNMYFSDTWANNK